jgi:small subunit ribosomal protein S8
MSMTDPISDLLARIRNGIEARKAHVDLPRSGLKLRVAQILRDEGFLEAVTEVTDASQGQISLALRYLEGNRSAISGLRRVSRPGQRWYVGARGLPKVRNGMGVAIVSTSRGVMTDREARKLGVGGEVLCEVW